MDLILRISGIFPKATRERPRPDLDGFMNQLISEKTNLPKSTVTMSSLNPSDATCIYSTLPHIIDQAKYLNIEIPNFVN